MKLIIKGESGLMLLRPSKWNRKVTLVGQRSDWVEVLEKTSGRQLYPQEVPIAPGAHEAERIENPFVPGGEPWLVLKGSRIGASESYFKGLAAATHGTSNGVELVATGAKLVVLKAPPQRLAA